MRFPEIGTRLKLWWRRRMPKPMGSQYPLSLTAAEWDSLKLLVSLPEWSVFRRILESYGELRCQRLLQPIGIDQTNVERGAIAALFEIAALPEHIVSRYGELKDDRVSDDESADLGWNWGNPLFRDKFRTGGSG